MLFGRHDLKRRTAIGWIRDVVEVVAIVAAGAWAFYIFAYENRIKPSWASPEVNFSATMQRLGETNGLLAVRVHQTMHNFGTVPAHFLGLAINVYGQRVSPASEKNQPPQIGTTYKYQALFRTTPAEALYSLAYVTRLGDRSSTQVTDLDPGDTLETDYMLFVPRGRYDLLTVEINGIYVKSTDRSVATRIVRSPSGAAKISAAPARGITTYDTNPLTSLNL